LSGDGLVSLFGIPIVIINFIKFTRLLHFNNLIGYLLFYQILI
jgi:hypothetical protein